MNLDLPSDHRSVNPFCAFTVNDWLVSRRCPLTPCERSILRVIMAHADWDTGDDSWPSLKTIAEEAGCSRATVCRALNRFDEFSDIGLPVTLKRERRFWKGQFTSNTYTIATNDNASQVRLPSLMVRQQELTSPNSDEIQKDPDLASLLSPEPDLTVAKASQVVAETLPPQEASRQVEENEEPGLASVSSAADDSSMPKTSSLPPATGPTFREQQAAARAQLLARKMSAGEFRFPVASKPRTIAAPLPELRDAPRAAIAAPRMFVEARTVALDYLGAFLRATGAEVAA